MSFLGNVIEKLKKRTADDLDSEILNRLIILSFLNLFSSLIFISFGIISLFNQDLLLTNKIMLSSVLFSASFIAVLNFFIFRKAKNEKISAVIFILTVAIVFLFVLITGGIFHDGYFWIISFPLIVIVLQGLKKGTRNTLIFLVIAVSATFFSKYYLQNSQYDDLRFLISLFGSYLVIFFAVYIFEYLRILNYRRLEKSILESKNENKKKDEFISKLSHQLRTPLNNITLISNLLNESKLDPENKDMFDTIIASSNNLINVVNNIVKISNIEFEEKTINKLSFNLFTTIENTLRLFKSQDKNRYDIHYKLVKPVKYNLIGDPIRIKQVFLNLIENLTKCQCKEKIFIDINIIPKDETSKVVNFTVEIFIKNLSLIQDEYNNTYKVNPKTLKSRKDDEIIMDFSVTEKILHLLGSFLDVQLNEHDTVLSFSLKLNKDLNKKLTDRIVEKKEEKKKEIIHAEKISDLEESNVLLVEDNSINQKIVLLSLKNKVKNIDVANNGKEALDKFGTTKYDIILMDIQMPIMNGIIATKKIRELEAVTNTHTPIIAITANALAGDKETCLAAGMNDYISKPFQVELLVQKMKDVLRK